MRARYAIAMALLVTTAFVGGVAGGVGGAQPTVDRADHPTPADHQTSTPGDHRSSPSGTHQTSDGDADACGFPLEVTDATGTTVTLDERPERITTTNPSAAQTLWEIGARDRVVGVTQFAAYLDGADERTDVSAEGLGVSVERVVDTDPDLVLAPNASADQVGDLREQDLTVYHFAEATSVEDIAAKTETIGRLVGNCEGAADTNDEMNEAVADVEERTADLDRPAALYPLGDGFVAADGTFINEIMRIGGVDNVAAAEHEGYPQLSNEVILQTDPEVLLVQSDDAAILDEEPYASTTAGGEGNYVVMNTNYLNQPGPRSVIESTETLATAVEELQAESDGGATGENDSDEMSDGEDGDGNDNDDASDDSDETGTEAPGFGVVAALVAAIATALIARRP
ncbi:PGF-CTERM-anchored ABC transporter substrate-binding protein [Halorubrum trueperi]|uniref:PGF-CTERM-anchored ABC transporter substrate-binding protein n=1 Tax=Halorubrum trueperi TaxID=2004704 RepID=A0ABD5UIP2_9EURY